MMIKRSNSVSGAYLLKRAAQLAKRIIPKRGRKTEIIDGFIVEGRRDKEQLRASVIDPPGELVSFGNSDGTAMERVYTAPGRDIFDPRLATASYQTLMETYREVVPRYQEDDAGPADRHVLGSAPPVNVFPIRITEGMAFEGEKGVYCCSLVTTHATWPIPGDAPVWLEVHYHRCGASDGRVGAILHQSVFESLAPGYAMFLGADYSAGVCSVGGVAMSWPHTDGVEYQDGVILTTFLRQLSPAPGDPYERSPSVVPLTLYLDLKRGEVVWHSLYRFENASHPAFVREVLPVMLDPQRRAEGEPAPATTDVWTWQEIGRPSLEIVGDKILVAFVVRATRPAWRYPVDGDWPYDMLVYRKFFALCTLTITPGELAPTDVYSHVDCWCSASSPAMELVPGADPAYMENSLHDPYLVGGQPYTSWYVMERPAIDYPNNGYDPRGIVRHPDVERHYYGNTVWATANNTLLTSDWTDNGNSLQVADIAIRGHATRRAAPFRTRLSDDTVAFAMYRFDGTRMYAVVIARGAEYAMMRPFAGYAATADAIKGKYGLTCPQREVLDEDGNVVVPFVLLAHAMATVDGVETPIVALRYGRDPAWYRYKAGAWADRGVAYVGNPLMLGSYGHIFEA